MKNFYMDDFRGRYTGSASINLHYCQAPVLRDFSYQRAYRPIEARRKEGLERHRAILGDVTGKNIPSKAIKSAHRRHFTEMVFAGYHENGKPKKIRKSTLSLREFVRRIREDDESQGFNVSLYGWDIYLKAFEWKKKTKS